MSEIEKAMAACELVSQLTERAIKIAEAVPFLKIVDEDSAILSVGKEECELRWAEYEGDYDYGGSLTRESFTFPTPLLFASDEALTLWQESERLKMEEQRRARDERYRADAIARERALYESLKAKFG